jgi:hypothetical protein
VARAKQTARAEARRRYRLANRLEDEAAPNELDGVESPTSGATQPGQRAAAVSSRAGASARSNAAPRPGLGSSFRLAYRPPQYRADLAALPGLLRSRGFLGAIGLVVGGAAVFAAFPGYSLSTLLFQTLTYPPAMAPIFVVGFFAPRASYLLGALVGVIDAFVYVGIAIAISQANASPLDPAVVPNLLGQALFTGVTTGALFAAAAAWYRRFLALSSPRRAAPAKGGTGRTATKAKAAGRR